MGQNRNGRTKSNPTGDPFLDAVAKVGRLQLKPWREFTINAALAAKEWSDIADIDLRQMTFDDVIERLSPVPHDEA